jgi:hypothetical protein
MLLRIFGWSLGLTAVTLIGALIVGGVKALVLVAVLCVLEISLSFDNAVVNATILGRMSASWQRLFLTVGMLVAVVGMRLALPLVLVGVTARLGPVTTVRLALAGGDVDQPGTYPAVLHDAHPAIAAFGGVFLLMLFLEFVFTDRPVTWLTWLERPLQRIGRLAQLQVVVALVALMASAEFLAPEPGTVMTAGGLGLVAYLLVNGLGSLFGGADVRAGVAATGRAGLFLFLYLEVLDASFSFDGVIGAFAITQDIFVIAAGLGVGAMYIRSITTLLVRKGTLARYVYLEHGAHWAIGALALILLVSIRYEVPEVVTGLIGVVFIAAATMSSTARNRGVAAAARRREVAFSDAR